MFNDTNESASTNGLHYWNILLGNGYDIGRSRNLASLEHDSQGFTIARAGDNVAIAFQETDAYQVMSRGVLCHPDYPVSLAKHK